MNIVHEEIHIGCIIVYHKHIKDGTKEETMYPRFSLEKGVELAGESVAKDKVAVYWFFGVCRRWLC
jgi:hypothetical protein